MRSETLFSRSQMAQFLRKSPYNVNLLIGGYEEKKGPSLYFMDYLASLHELPRCAHGYAAHFTLGLLDRFYKKDLTEAEGIDIIHKCIHELATRFLVNRTGFTIKIVDKVCCRSFFESISHRMVCASSRPRFTRYQIEDVILL